MHFDVAAVRLPVLAGDAERESRNGAIDHTVRRRSHCGCSALESGGIFKGSDYRALGQSTLTETEEPGGSGELDCADVRLVAEGFGHTRNEMRNQLYICVGRKASSGSAGNGTVFRGPAVKIGIGVRDGCGQLY